MRLRRKRKQILKKPTGSKLATNQNHKKPTGTKLANFSLHTDRILDTKLSSYQMQNNRLQSDISKVTTDSNSSDTGSKLAKLDKLESGSEVANNTSVASKPVRITQWQVNTSLTPVEIVARKEQFLFAFYSTSGSVARACQQAGVSTRQVYKWRLDDIDFKAAWDAVTEHRLDLAEQALDRLVAKGNAAATIFHLKTQGKRRGYIERLQLEKKDNNQEVLTETQVLSKLAKLQESLDIINKQKKTATLLLSSSQEKRFDKANSQDANIVTD